MHTISDVRSNQFISTARLVDMLNYSNQSRCVIEVLTEILERLELLPATITRILSDEKKIPTHRLVDPAGESWLIYLVTVTGSASGYYLPIVLKPDGSIADYHKQLNVWAMIYMGRQLREHHLELTSVAMDDMSSIHIISRMARTCNISMDTLIGIELRQFKYRYTPDGLPIDPEFDLGYNAMQWIGMFEADSVLYPYGLQTGLEPMFRSMPDFLHCVRYAHEKLGYEYNDPAMFEAVCNLVARDIGITDRDRVAVYYYAVIDVVNNRLKDI